MFSRKSLVTLLLSWGSLRRTRPRLVILHGLFLPHTVYVYVNIALYLIDDDPCRVKDTCLSILSPSFNPPAVIPPSFYAPCLPAVAFLLFGPTLVFSLYFFLSFLGHMRIRTYLEAILSFLVVA